MLHSTNTILSTALHLECRVKSRQLRNIGTLTGNMTSSAIHVNTCTLVADEYPQGRKRTAEALNIASLRCRCVSPHPLDLIALTAPLQR